MKRRIGKNPYIVELSGIECVDIDYPEDFAIANAIYTNLILNGGGGGRRTDQHTVRTFNRLILNTVAFRMGVAA